jgi:hypothetical protein
MYEVLISTTIAMILLPLNFWTAAEVVVLVGMISMLWDLRDNVLGDYELGPRVAIRPQRAHHQLLL